MLQGSEELLTLLLQLFSEVGNSCFLFGLSELSTNYTEITNMATRQKDHFVV